MFCPAYTFLRDGKGISNGSGFQDLCIKHFLLLCNIVITLPFLLNPWYSGLRLVWFIARGQLVVWNSTVMAYPFFCQTVTSQLLYGLAVITVVTTPPRAVIVSWCPGACARRITYGEYP